MGHSRGRLMLVLATTVAALATFGTAPATAAAAAELEYHDTTVVAGQPNLLKVHVSMQPRAKLTDAASGAPVAGQRVDFWLNLGPLPAGGPICVAQTDSAGVAKCPPLGFRDIYSLMLFGYEARFNAVTVGDIRYNQSSDMVKLFGRQ